MPWQGWLYHENAHLHRGKPLRRTWLQEADREPGLRRCSHRHSKIGGLFESKRISDLADMWDIWTAAHNPASPIGTIGSVDASASMRGFRIRQRSNTLIPFEVLSRPSSKTCSTFST